MPQNLLPNKILDSWAVLALLQEEEPAAQVVAKTLLEAEQKRCKLLMSWINAGEIYYTIGKRHGLQVAQQCLDDISSLPITLNTPNKTQILAAATIKAQYALSYADAFAVALAQEHTATLLTGDKEIIRLGSTIVKTQALYRE